MRYLGTSGIYLACFPSFRPWKDETQESGLSLSGLQSEFKTAQATEGNPASIKISSDKGTEDLALNGCTYVA